MLFLLAVAAGVNAQYDTVKVFDGYKQPVVIGILKFDGNSPGFEKTLFSELKKNDDVKKKFEISSYESLNKVKSSFGLKNLNPNDKSTLRKLQSEMGIDFVVAGSFINNAADLKIIKTSSGDEIYTFNYGPPDLIASIVRLFSNFEKPVSVDSKTQKGKVASYNNMVFVEGGYFTMGSGSGYDDENPEHKIFINNFYLDETEVTFDEYDRFCEETGRKKPDDAGWGRGKRPVINVSWTDAVEYAKWAGKRLPTEAEWEYAAKGGNKSKGYTYSGSNSIEEAAWHNANSGSKTHPVGGKTPNELGIYDMSGNVSEWCSDWYGEDYYKNSVQSNPKGSDVGDFRVIRGGSWFRNDKICRSASREASNPEITYCNIGFRCAKDK